MQQTSKSRIDQEIAALKKAKKEIRPADIAQKCGESPKRIAAFVRARPDVERIDIAKNFTGSVWRFI